MQLSKTNSYITKRLLRMLTYLNIQKVQTGVIASNMKDLSSSEFFHLVDNQLLTYIELLLEKTKRVYLLA